MAAQTGDELPASRSGIIGKITVQNILDLIPPVALDTTNLVVVPESNIQDYAEGVDHSLLKARGSGVSSTYVSTVVVGGTTFSQPAVSGEIHSDQGYFDIHYAGATNITVTNLNVASVYVYIDNAGVLQQQTSIPTRQDWSRKMFTMRIAIDLSNNTIIGFEYLNNPIGHYANSIRDVYTYLLAQGVPFKKDQVVTGRANDLGFDVSAGSIMEFGGTGDIDNANIITLNAVSNATFFLATRTSFDSGTNTDLPKFWDNNGVITALGSTTLVGHRLYRFSNGNLVMQYGQGNYANMTLAKAGVVLEDYVLNPILKNATFFGWWFIESTATNTGGTTLTDFKEYTLGLQGGSSSGLSGCLLKGNNLSDLLDVNTARTNLGVKFEDGTDALDAVYMDGNVGIGKQPQSGFYLDVNGKIVVRSQIYVDSSLIHFGPTSFEIKSANSIALIPGNSEAMRITSGGNVGIGISTPTEALDVVGKIALNDGGNSVFIGEGAGLNDDGTANNNVGIGKSSLQNNTTGANNTATGLNSLVNSTTGSQNTSSGTYSLQANTSGGSNSVNGYASLLNNTTGSNNTANGYNSGRFISNGTTANTITSNSIYLGYNTKALANNQTNQIVIGYDATGVGSNSVVLGNDSIDVTALKGNVGIGTTTPSDLLHVKSGTGDSIVRIQSYGVNGNKSGVRFQNSSDNNNNAGGIYSERIGGIEHDIIIETWGNPSGTERLRVKNNGNVGIGTTAPTEALDVVGKIALNDGGNSVFIGTNAGLNDDGTANLNVGVGVDSLRNNTTGGRNTATGWESLRANTTGGYNTANGLQSLLSNTTGNNNTASGVYSLQDNTTGGNNTSTGYASLRNNISGGNNTANGLNSLANNTVGSSNSANGYSSLSNNTTGYYNTSNGRDSGRYISDGTTNNSISNNSLYLGYNTKALANNQTNQIVIGYDATGNGSNSVVLGNDSITKTTLRGNVTTDGSVQVGDNTDTAIASNVGAMRYRTDAVASYADMAMETSAGVYAWVNIVTNTF